MEEMYVVFYKLFSTLKQNTDLPTNAGGDPIREGDPLIAHFWTCVSF